jgi:hypothetical protein
VWALQQDDGDKLLELKGSAEMLSVVGDAGSGMGSGSREGRGCGTGGSSSGSELGNQLHQPHATRLLGENAATEQHNQGEAV